MDNGAIGVIGRPIVLCLVGKAPDTAQEIASSQAHAEWD